MKTTLALALALLLALSACSTAPRPLAARPSTPVAAPARDTTGTAYAEGEARRSADWEWYAGGGR